MAYGQLYEETGAPFKGRKREKLVSFLSDSGLDYDDTVDYSVMLCEDDGTPAAAGSLSGKVIKCIAVAESHRGENLTARVISLITDEAVRRGITHLFLYPSVSLHEAGKHLPVFGGVILSRTSDEGRAVHGKQKRRHRRVH